MCSEMERYVTGRRIRRNGGSRTGEGEISRELLGKYMRESFQLRESMDVARELCLELREGVSAAGRAKVDQVIKVLSQGEEVSMVDQY